MGPRAGATYHQKIEVIIPMLEENSPLSAELTKGAKVLAVEGDTATLIDGLVVSPPSQQNGTHYTIEFEKEAEKTFQIPHWLVLSRPTQ